jgi:hypothetical protein
MGTSVFRIRTAVDCPPVLKSDHTMRSCRAASLDAGRPDSFKPRHLHVTAGKSWDWWTGFLESCKGATYPYPRRLRMAPWSL